MTPAMTLSRISARGAGGAIVLAVGLGCPQGVVADIRHKVEVEAGLTAASNPLLIPGADRSAVIVDGGIRPSVELEDMTGLSLELSGLLAGRHYSRRYEDLLHGNAQLSADWRKNEWLSVTASAAFNRDPLIDRVTSDIDASVDSSGVREALTGRLSASWNPDAYTNIQPELGVERVHYPGTTPLGDTKSTMLGLHAARRTSARTRLGMRLGYADNRVDAGLDSKIYAAYGTLDRRLSESWRLRAELGVEHVRSTIYRTTQTGGRVELCRESSRLTACASGGLTSMVSGLGGVQRRIDLATTASWRLTPRLTMRLDGQYQRATQQRSTLPRIDTAQARLRFERRLNRGLTASAVAEYRRRELLDGRALSSAAVGVQLKYELLPL